MGICTYCGVQETMPFKCKFCQNTYCGEHRLPENHGCVGLAAFKEKRSKAPEKWIYEPFHAKYKEEAGRKIKKPLKERVTDFFKDIDQKKVLYLILVFIVVVLILELIQSFNR